MADNYVTVATFHKTFEAELARNLLEEEGIASLVLGELTADWMPFGQAGGGDQIVLQVHEDDAHRAAGLLAAVAAAKLDDNWEDEAESGAGVWLCSICGEPISNRLSICYSCQTPREGIRADAPRARTGIQREPTALLVTEDVQKRDEITRDPAPAPVSPPPLKPISPARHEDEDDDEPPLSAGDELARHAFGAAFFGLLTIVLLPLSWYYLIRLLFYPDELSPKGMRYFYGALLVNGFFMLVALALCAGGARLLI